MDLSVGLVKLKDRDCLLTIIRDISERKQMEEALKQERDMLEDITKNIGAGLTIVDRDCQIQWVNKHLGDSIGEEVIGKPCYSTFNTLNKVCPDCGPKKIFEGANLILVNISINPCMIKVSIAGLNS